MKIFHFENPFPYIILEDTYSDDELRLIWEELNFICYPHKLKPPQETGSAKSSNENKILKRNNAIWIDTLYEDRNLSNILKINRKLFLNFEDIILSHSSWFFKHFETNFDTTLISYYEKNDYYEPHKDSSVITCLTWFYKEPKKFEGGDLYFTDYNIEHKIKNNSTLIFPSKIRHAVSTIKMNEENMNKKQGRFCMTQFMHIVP